MGFPSSVRYACPSWFCTRFISRFVKFCFMNGAAIAGSTSRNRSRRTCRTRSMLEPRFTTSVDRRACACDAVKNSSDVASWTMACLSFSDRRSLLIISSTPSMLMTASFLPGILSSLSTVTCTTPVRGTSNRDPGMYCDATCSRVSRSVLSSNCTIDPDRVLPSRGCFALFWARWCGSTCQPHPDEHLPTRPQRVAGVVPPPPPYLAHVPTHDLGRAMNHEPRLEHLAPLRRHPPQPIRRLAQLPPSHVVRSLLLVILDNGCALSTELGAAGSGALGEEQVLRVGAVRGGPEQLPVEGTSRGPHAAGFAVGKHVVQQVRQVLTQAPPQGFRARQLSRAPHATIQRQGMQQL